MPQTSDLSKECLYTALLQLMETMPYEKISITDLANRAGVSRTAYYRNYESKEDILLQQSLKILEEFEQSIYADPSATAENYWSRYFWRFYNDPIVAALLQADLLKQMSQHHNQATLRIFNRKFGWDVSKEENAMFLLSGIGAVVGMIQYTVLVNPNFSKRNADRMLRSLNQMRVQVNKR